MNKIIQRLAKNLASFNSLTVSGSGHSYLSDYSRASRGQLAGLWIDDGGDIVGDDLDLSTLIFKLDERIIACR